MCARGEPSTITLLAPVTIDPAHESLILAAGCTVFFLPLFYIKIMNVG